MLKEKWILYWIFFFLVITVKEDSNIVLFGIGLFLLLKRNFKIGILSIIIPLIIFPATILYIIPAFPHPHRVSEIAFIERWNNFGNDVNSILFNMINPLKSFKEIATTEKIKSVLGILRQVLLLPIINFKTIILMFPYLFFVLSSNYGTMYRFEYHYALILIPILYLAFFENLKWLKKFKIKKLELIVAVLLILTTFYSIRNIYINMSPNMKQLEDAHKFDIALDMISIIPNNEGISVSKTLISRVPVRYERHYLPYGIEKSNYVIVYTKEQTSGYDKDITPFIADSLTKSSNWKIVREEGDFIMFSKN